MLFSVGFMVTFLLGGLSGVMLASPPIDFHVTDTYFLVAHFHYVLFGTIVFATYAGISSWFPKMTDRLLDERLGKLHFWLTLIGFHTTFSVQHWLGNEGMPRRYADYLTTDGFTTLNIVLQRSGRSRSSHPCCPSSGTSLRATATAKSSSSMTRGATAAPWNGPPPARRHGTTSPNCPGSARSGPLSNCTTRTWPSGCARRIPHRPPMSLRPGRRNRDADRTQERPLRRMSRATCDRRITSARSVSMSNRIRAVRRELTARRRRRSRTEGSRLCRLPTRADSSDKGNTVIAELHTLNRAEAGQ